jgi:hypothetical protein
MKQIIPVGQGVAGESADALIIQEQRNIFRSYDARQSFVGLD